MERDLSKSNIDVANDAWGGQAGQSQEERSLGCRWGESDYDDHDQYGDEQYPPPGSVWVVHRLGGGALIPSI